jgi:hypothetical protein
MIRPMTNESFEVSKLLRFLCLFPKSKCFAADQVRRAPFPFINFSMPIIRIYPYSHAVNLVLANALDGWA